jgi:hypothetical protein
MARISSLLVVGAILLPGLSLASPTSQSDIVVRSASKIQVTNVTRVDLAEIVGASSGLAVASPAAIKPYSDTLVGGLIVANTAIIAGVGVCASTTGGLGTLPCVGLGIGAIALNYLTVWLFGSTSVVRRSGAVVDGDLPTIQVHSAWHPVDGCGTACAFVASAPAHTWTPFGNTTYADGTVVHINAMHDGIEGGVRGLQAIVPSSAAPASASRRQLETDYNSVTAQFYFEQEDETARDDFINDYDGNANDLANVIGETMSDWAAQWNGVVMCGNFDDDDGFATDGLWTVDDGDNYYGLDTSTAENYLTACAGI